MKVRINEVLLSVPLAGTIVLSMGLAVYVVSSMTWHDILNQITTIRGLGELMRERPLENEDVKRFSKMITTTAESIERQFLFAPDY